MSIKKRNRRVIESDDDEEAILEEKMEAVEEQPSTQEHRTEELTATTKKLKLDPISPKTPKAQPIAVRESETVKPLSSNDAKVQEEEAEKPADDDGEVDAKVEADEIKQEKEAAAKW